MFLTDEDWEANWKTKMLGGTTIVREFALFPGFVFYHMCVWKVLNVSVTFFQMTAEPGRIVTAIDDCMSVR